MGYSIHVLCTVSDFHFQGEEEHPGMEMMYEYHSNQTQDPQNVLMHALGEWRLTQLFHDLAFLPQVVVSIRRPIGSHEMRLFHDLAFLPQIVMNICRPTRSHETRGCSMIYSSSLSSWGVSVYRREIAVPSFHISSSGRREYLSTHM